MASLVEFSGPRYWRGSNYRSNPLALRILIVGESHYGEPDESNDIEATERTVRNRIDHVQHERFFGIIEHILLGYKPKIFEIGAVWNSLAFINYAPHLVRNGRSASLEHFIGARPRFVEAVRELEPQLILFFSRKAWSNRPVSRESTWRDAFGVDPVEINDRQVMYDYNTDCALAVSFNHPAGLIEPIPVWHEHFIKSYCQRYSGIYSKIL